jgi:hypothetical protein
MACCYRKKCFHDVNIQLKVIQHSQMSPTLLSLFNCPTERIVQIHGQVSVPVLIGYSAVQSTPRRRSDKQCRQLVRGLMMAYLKLRKKKPNFSVDMETFGKPPPPLPLPRYVVCERPLRQGTSTLKSKLVRGHGCTLPGFSSFLNRSSLSQVPTTTGPGDDKLAWKYQICTTMFAIS